MSLLRVGSALPVAAARRRLFSSGLVATQSATFGGSTSSSSTATSSSNYNRPNSIVRTVAARGSSSSSHGASHFAAMVMGVAVTGAVLAASDDEARRVHAAAMPLPYNVEAVKKDIIKVMESMDEKSGDGTSIAGTFVRLAWHASGTYSAADGTGGSNGSCMRMAPESEWGANAGLSVARKALCPIQEKYPGLTHADLWTLAGATAITYMGGPEIKWQGGRTDSDTPTTVPDGRLPDADKGCLRGTVQHVRDIFGRMGFSDREMVALIGAHAVGRCHLKASGYWGPWTFAETTFSNEYYRLLLEEKWTLKTTHNGAPWTGPDQYEDPTGKLMMLPSDMALVWDKGFRKIVEEYAKDEDLFFKDFSEAFSKLLHLGVTPAATGGAGGIIASLRKMVGL